MEQTIADGGIHSPTREQPRLIGTVNQVAWAEQIRARVDAEFDRVANAIKTTATGQTEPRRLDTAAIIAVLEEKRAEVMAKDQAGYFIQAWQELRDQVRSLITQDSRYKAIRADVRTDDVDAQIHVVKVK
jgi:hypothetical protein